MKAWLKEHLGLLITLIITVIYLFMILIITDLSEYKGLELNEKGDLLAGVFSPLAFLWLVFGYLQQGQELKQNAKALNQQALELKNSVDEQRKLIAIQEKEQQEKHFQVLPEFKKSTHNIRKYTHPCAIDDGEGTIIETIEEKRLEFSFTFVNRGELAKNVLVKSFEDEFYVRVVKDKIHFEESLNIKFDLDEQIIESLENGKEYFCTLILTYTNLYGKPYTKYIRYSIGAYLDFKEEEVDFSLSVSIHD